MKKITFLILLAVCGNSCFGQIITTIAGTGGVTGYSGDGHSATAATLTDPAGIVFDGHGNLIFTDFYNNVIRKITPSGIITTIAGTGSGSFGGDHGPATAAGLNHPCGLLFNSIGNLLIADEGNEVIRMIDTNGIITTIVGNTIVGSFGDGGPASSAEMSNPCRIAFDASGNLFIADYGNHRIRRVDHITNTITTIAGTGSPGFSGDHGPATNAMINQPTDVTFDNTGNFYICDQNNQRIRKVDTAGIITTIAGNGIIGSIGDGNPATAAEFYYPSTVTVDVLGNLLIDDSYNNKIRKIGPTGIITTIVGTGAAGYSGDNGPATAAKLNQPWIVSIDVCGNLIVADAFNYVIRKVTYNSVLPPISASGTLYADSSITLTNAAPGGTWSINTVGDATIATIDSATGKITGVSAGTVVVTYTSDCGITTDTVAVHRNTTFLPYLNSNATLVITPNPNKGIFTIKGTLPDFASTQDLAIDVMDMLGRIIYTGQLRIDNGVINKTVTLNDNTTKGIYIVKMKTGAANEQMLISVEH